MSKDVKNGLEYAGEHSVLVPARVREAARGASRLLQGLCATGGGFFPRATGDLLRRSSGTSYATLIYCVKGAGWSEMAGQRLPIREGDLLVVAPKVPHACGASSAHPWTIHWAQAEGALVPDFLEALGVSPKRPLLAMRDDLQLVLLFNEVLKCLERGFAFPDLLRASQALGHLMALAVQHRQDLTPDEPGGLQKVARCIEYMSEHLDQPLKVAALASLANLSSAHFAVLFRQQTGSSPRDYLHLLRMHQACRWLTRTTMSLKEIASRLGYQDQFHFSRKFKSFAGVSPSRYRATQPAGQEPD